MGKIGICIAGYGAFGRKLHGYLSKIEDYEVRCIYHPDEVKAKSHGPLGAHILGRVLGNEAINAFVIATPNDQHSDLIRWIFEVGRQHIFVEKPMTGSYAEAKEIAKVVDGRVFMVGHCQRRESVFRKAKNLISSGIIGKVVNLTFNFSHGGAYNVDSANWRCSSARNREGSLAMLGTHCIDTILHLLGPVKSVYARLANLSEKTEAPDTSAVFLEMNSGASAFFQSNYNTPSEKRCEIFGTEGVIYIDRDRIWLRIGRDQNQNGRFIPSELQRMATDGTDPIEEELREFAKVIRSGGKVETGFMAGFEVMRVMEAIYQSAVQNTPQRLSY